MNDSYCIRNKSKREKENKQIKYFEKILKVSSFNKLLTLHIP